MLMTARTCKARKENGEPCRQAPLQGKDFCFWHDPEHAQEAAEARRLGGLRRRRERTVAGAYAFEGLETVTGVRRLLEVAALDTLGLENSVARSRTLAYLAQVSVRLLEVGELEARLAALEATVNGRQDRPESPFDTEPPEGTTGFEGRVA